METNIIIFAALLTIFAGFATTIGGLSVLFVKKFNPKILSFALGLSAGVMIYVSLVEIFAKAKNFLTTELGIERGSWITVISFFAGILVIALIDKLTPSLEFHFTKNIADEKSKGLLRMGVFSAIAIFIHNFPEGLATFMGALADPFLGVSLAIAIAIHNIPEGIAIAMPIYYSTKSKSKSLIITFLSGMAEPVGALVGFFLLSSIFNGTVFGIVFALVAGIMVYISFDELIPTAEEQAGHHTALMGLIVGMFIIAISLLLPL